MFFQHLLSDVWAPLSSKVWRIVAVICFWYIAFRKWADTMAPHLNNGTRILFLRGTQANTPPRTQKLWLIFLQLDVKSLWRRTQSFEIENTKWFVKLSKLKAKQLPLKKKGKELHIQTKIDPGHFYHFPFGLELPEIGVN